MLRSILRAAGTTSSKTYQWQLRTTAIPAATYSTKPKKDKSKADAKKFTSDASADHHDAVSDEQVRARFLATDEKDPSLDVGPNGRPLFTSTPSLSQLTRKDTCSYFKFTMKDLSAVLPEGLPTGMLKEFEDSMRNALLVRQSFLDLRDNFRRVVDPPMWSSNAKGPKIRKQILLDGPVSCGKSIALAMLVQWAREEGWLTFYVSKGQDWTHGGFFYKHPQTGLWDTPVQAENVLKARMLISFVCVCVCTLLV